MSEQLWDGIPRREIPWFPSVDEDLCIGCQLFIDTCPGDVYDWDELKVVPIVARPDNCVVYCVGCAKNCTEDAITFPTKEQILDLVKQLRVKYTA